MKTATIIFVALTVFSGLFLESSSAPSLLEDTVGIISTVGKGVGGLVKNTLGTVGDLDLLNKLLDGIANGLFPELKELVAGLLKEVDKVLAEASSDELKELCTKIKELLYKLIEIIVEISKAVPEAVTTGTLDTVEPCVADINSIISELKQLSDVPDVFKNTLTKVIELVEVILTRLVGIIEKIKNLLPQLKEVLKEVKALFDGILGELSGEIAEKLGEPLKKVEKLVTELLTEQENGNIVAVQKLEVLLCKVIKKLKAIVAKLLEKLGGAAEEILEKVLQVVKKVLKKVRKALRPIVKKLVNGVKDICSKLKEDLEGILKKIKEVLADAKAELKELLIEIKRLLKKLLEKLLDLIKAVVALFANVTEESSNIVIGLLKEIEVIVAKITGLTESKVDILGEELAGWILEVLATVEVPVFLVEDIVGIVRNP